MNLDKDGTGDELTSVKRRPNGSEFLDLDAKINKSGLGEVKTLTSDMPLFWITKTLIIIVVL